MEFKFKSKLYLYGGQASWHFIDLPGRIASDIKAIAAGNTAGFGSVKVEVNIGDSNWRTSIFPDNKKQTFLLPIKKSVRAQQNLRAGDIVDTKIKLVDFEV